jgi:hypothetical protein
MKKLVAAAALAALAIPAAFAGDCEYACQNHCPLAQEANSHRATGAEAVQTSSVVRADLAATVERNLGRI